MMKQVKIIQSRLKSRGVRASSELIRDYLQQCFPDKKTLLEEEIVSVVDHIKAELSESSLAVRQTNIEKAQSSGERVLSPRDFAPEQRVEQVKQTAVEMSVNLSLEQIKEVASKISWLTTSRSEMVARIKDAIASYIDYQISQDREDLKLVIDNAEKTLRHGLEENSQNFSQSAQAFCGRVEEIQKSFRSTEREILELFKIPVGKSAVS